MGSRSNKDDRRTLSVTVVPRQSTPKSEPEPAPKEERETTPTAKTIPGAALQLRDRKRRVDNAIEEGSK